MAGYGGGAESPGSDGGAACDQSDQARFRLVSAGTATPEAPVAPSEASGPSVVDGSRRRFTIAVVAGMVVVSLPYLWVLWDLWSGAPSPLRAASPSDFYELQARAMFHGHLSVPTGSLGIEAFVHDGRQYTYFGLFPSLIRMPILLFTSRLDGRLTAPALLVAWAATGVFSSLALWRVRVLMRGAAVLGRAEAASYGVLVASITGGSVLVYLAATPFVYSEDIAWSVALTIGSMFALLGVIERASWGRIAAAGVLILAANLDRSPAGYACAIGALLVATWFFLGRYGQGNRRWVLPMVMVGLVPLAVSGAVNWAKFGLPFGLPLSDQVWSHINAHRAHFLAANGGKAFSVGFLPSTLSAYLQPSGLHFSSVFPFITLPTSPAPALAGAVLDETYPTASITATEPLLFLLSCCGVLAAFRPHPTGRVRLTRIPLVASAAGVTGAVVWGLITERYMADFLPFLTLASSVGLVALWSRFGRRRRFPIVLLVAVTALGIYSVAANVAVSVTPTPQWTTAQLQRFVTFQRQVTPRALESTVRQGHALPYWAPAGQLFAADNCAALYVSNGRSFADVPGQQLQHFTWLPVEQGPGINHTIDLIFNRPVSGLSRPLPLITMGRSALVIEPAGKGLVRFTVENPGAPSPDYPSASGSPWRPALHQVYQVEVMTDPYLRSIFAQFANGDGIVSHYLAGRGPAVVRSTMAGAGGISPVLSVSDVTGPPPSMSLCRHLVRRTSTP